MTTDKKLRLGVIFGGRSGEHEVSLASARSVLDALDPHKYEITQIGISKTGQWLVGENVWEVLLDGRAEDLTSATLLPIPGRSVLYTIQPHETGEILQSLTSLDVVFPVLHGTFGEDGTLQGLLEMADLAYVGAGVLGSSVGMDKGVFKDVMLANDIPVVESVIVLRREIENDIEVIVNRVEELAPYPVFVKPANMGSSVGVSKCKNVLSLKEGLRDAARYDRRILVERGVNAREIELSVLGNDAPRASIPGEICPTAEFYSYEAKYHDNNSELLIPAPVSPEQTAYLQEIAVRAYKAIDCAGMARVDFMIDKDTGNIYLNEVNTIPGFTPISMYPKLWSASGLPYPDLIDELVNLALERRADRDQTEWGFDF
ncbi:MAG: D-alanine--D-alanine ligase A [Anaerolineaceae bacterium 4572_5.1]|nr:MAG: D-alanine--D-alanine ligase A [Anaerolineaceae bacterium 4572_5.1]RLD08740.1 MAG: D-alanine--D-alanine ligase A [Chloroflexota bacterium]